MVLKKKFHGGLKVLLLLLFIIFLGNFSTCYARTTLTDEESEYLWNYFFNNTYASNIAFSSIKNLSSRGIAFSQDYYNYKDSFKTYFNTVNDLDISENTWFFTDWTGNSNWNLYWFNFNNTISDNLPFICLDFQSISSNDKVLLLKAIDDNKNGVSLVGRKITLSFDLTSFSNYSTYTLPSNGISLHIYGNGNFSTNNLILNAFAGLTNLCRIPISVIYTDYNGSFTNNNFISYFYENFFEFPVEPSGDNPIEGGTGTITNPSGEVTGTIDLSGIEQGIGNIQNQISGDTQKVIENQNQNTETIVNALSGETEKITNMLTDSADDLIDNTIITSGDIKSALNFKIAQDPYSNFWFTLTNNLKSALLGTKRSIDISFQGRTWTLSLDEYMTLPPWLIIILTPFSTAFFTWVLVRQFKLIFDKLSSGNVDSLLKENSEERYF